MFLFRYSLSHYHIDNPDALVIILIIIVIVIVIIHHPSSVDG
jgi:hypothetical protein